MTPETEVSAELRQTFIRMQAAGRCTWMEEVRLMCWTHAQKSRPDFLRIDYVARLDSGPLLGFEVKRRPERPAELGAHLAQCGQYSAGLVTAQIFQSAECRSWQDQPLAAVFLRVDAEGMDPYVLEHAKAAVRLWGPMNVGFAKIRPKHGLFLQLGTSERWYSERDGYRADAFDRTAKFGSGKQRIFHLLAGGKG